MTRVDRPGSRMKLGSREGKRTSELGTIESHRETEIKSKFKNQKTVSRKQCI